MGLFDFLGPIVGAGASAIPGIGPFLGPMAGAALSGLGAARGGGNNQWLQGLTTNQLNMADQNMGTAMDIYGSWANPFRDWSLGALDRYGQGLNGGLDFLGGSMQDFMGGLGPGAFRNPFLTPGNDQDFSNMEGIGGRVDPMYDMLYGNMAGGGRTFDSGVLGDRYRNQIGQRDMGYDAAAGFLNNGGMTQFNQPSVERMNDAINAGGWNSEMRGSYGFGGDMMRGAMGSGGMNAGLDALSQTGQGIMGMGQGLIGQGLGAYGQGQFTPGMQAAQQQGQGLFGTAMSGGMTPEAQGLGAAGAAFTGRALGSPTQANSPYADALMSQGQDLLGRAGSQGGMTGGLNEIMGRGGQLFDQAANSAGFIAPQYQQAFDQAMGLMSGRGIDLSGIGGGGGAFGGTAQAGAMQRAAMDPAWLNTMKKKVGGLFDGTGSSLMPLAQALSFGKDTAGQAARKSYEAAQRRAALRGGASGSVTGAGFNDPMLEFADEISQAEASGLRDAWAQRQALGLQEQQQALNAGQDISGQETSRYGIDTNAAIQDAQNQTQASIASAGNQTQASIANSNAATAAANARAQLLGQQISAGSGLLGNVLGLTSQNFLGGTNNALSQMNNAQQTAANRYGNELDAGVSALSNAGGIANNAQGNLNQRYGTDVNAGISGLTNFADIARQGRQGGIDAATNLQLRPEEIAANRFGTSANYAANLAGTGMQGVLGGGGMMTDAQRIASGNRNSDMGIGRDLQLGAMNLAPDMIRAYTSAGQVGLNDALGRAQLGGQLFGQYQGNQRGMMGDYRALLGQEQDYGLNSGRLINDITNTQGNIWNNLSRNRLEGNRLGIDAGRAWSDANQGMFDLYGRNIIQPNMSMLQNTTGGMRDMATNWGNNWTNLARGRMGIGTGASGQPSPGSQWLGQFGSAISQLPIPGMGGRQGGNDGGWGFEQIMNNAGMGNRNPGAGINLPTFGGARNTSYAPTSSVNFSRQQENDFLRSMDNYIQQTGFNPGRNTVGNY